MIAKQTSYKASKVTTLGVYEAAKISEMALKEFLQDDGDIDISDGSVRIEVIFFTIIQHVCNQSTMLNNPHPTGTKHGTSPRCWVRP